MRTRLLELLTCFTLGSFGHAFAGAATTPSGSILLDDRSATAHSGGAPNQPGTQQGTGRTLLRVEATEETASIMHLGWDTEGGDRARHNLIRSPLGLRIRIGERWQSLSQLPTKPEVIGGSEVRYRVAVAPGAELTWNVRVGAGRLTLRVMRQGENWDQVRALELLFPFNPRLTATTVISGDWTKDGKLRLPAIISAPDMGQMLLQCHQHPNSEARLEGSRPGQWVDFVLELPVPAAEGYTIELSPVVLPPPKDLKDVHRWQSARRGWFNFLQVNAERGKRTKEPASPAGVWANNVISNPVSSTLYWLGDHVLLVPQLAPGVPSAPLLRRTLEYWMYEKTAPDGRVHYTEEGPKQMMMDSNPAVVIGAWCYVEATGDMLWLKSHIDRIEFISKYSEQRDIDNDGLLESTQRGNRGTYTFGDTAWDTYSSGHKNGYANALAYRAFRGLADLEFRLGRHDQQRHYDEMADRLKSAYVETFYNPNTGWLGWWRSEDGVLHDVYSDVVTSLAIMYGLVDEERGRRMLDTYWAELDKSGFRRFDLGTPLNVRPVHRDDQLKPWGGNKEDGSDTFGKYLNGGCCVSNTYYFLVANYMVGNTARADMILDAMLKRQSEGVFDNGGGFQNGVVNKYPQGAEFFDWNGNTCGYEGHLVYSWTFLQAILLREPLYRERVYRPLLKKGSSRNPS